MRSTFLAVCAVCAAPVPSFADEPKPPAKAPRDIPPLMHEIHQRGRQVYRALDQLLVSGRSTAAERKRVLDAYTKMRELTPPQGSAEGWRHDVDRVIAVVRELDESKDEATALAAGVKLYYATNCTACHEKYRYVPKPAPNEAAPKSLEAGLKAIQAGGKHWAAPEKLDLGETKIFQPGRRLVVWPADDVVYAAHRDGKYADFTVTFNYALRPGAAHPFSQVGGQYYHTYDLGNKNAFSYQFAKPADVNAREGQLGVSFRVIGEGRPAGEYELVFVPMLNETVSVPAGNVVRVKYRLPK